MKHFVMIFAGTLTLIITLPAFGLNGTVQSLSFIGPITGREVHFSLYLPPGYEHPGNMNRYPVVYHLHGLNGKHDGDQTSTVSASLERAVNDGLIEPCIIVFPDGYFNSMWADSFDLVKPAETDIMQQLIPYVDANYRTRPSRCQRVIQGFSMGGFGAAKFAAKFPESFAVCVIYDGALHTWATLNANRPEIVAEIFNGSESEFNLFSPWHWTSLNADLLRTNLPFRQVVGALTNYGRSWRDFLQDTYNIPIEHVETGLKHNLGPLLNAQGSNSWAFIAAHLDITQNSDLTGDNFVGLEDFAVIAKWWLDECDASNDFCDGADFDLSGQIDIDDLLRIVQEWLEGERKSLPVFVIL